MQVECANPNCCHTVHSLKLRLGITGPGEKRGDQWFCSRKCYFDVLADQFIAAKRDRVKKTVRRVKLGLLLLKNNLITKETLSMALEQQANSPKKLGEILVDTGKISARELKSALSVQAGVAPVSLDAHLKVRLKDEIPFKLIREFHFVCFRYDGEQKTMANAIYDLELLPVLEEIFAEMYPGFLIKFYLDDKEKLLTILSGNYPQEKLTEQPVPLYTGEKGTKLEKFVYRVVDFLNTISAEDITIDQQADSIRITSKINNLDVDIKIS
jgi:hypothetical protein